MVTTARRVSYILPSPDQPPPLLSLPPLGQSRQSHPQPFLTPKNETSASTLGSRNPFLTPPPAEVAKPSHPRHCLGITSLALDTSTLLANADSPGGILYTGGRDGLVASWELGVPHRRRRGGRYEPLPGRESRVKWERIGDGADFFDDDELEDDDDRNDDLISSDDENEGWVGIGEKGKGEVPYEDRWEVDRDQLVNKPPPTSFRQSAQTHTDWVNAMLLCNRNRTVVTASSDRTIRAWNPHASTDDPAKLSPALVGSHRDYVRALAWAKYPSLLFSGALDRHLSIWDIQAQTHEPILNIDLNKVDEDGGIGLEGERGSVYALGVDHAAHVLAAGTPERVVRLWDPRAGDRSLGKLIGHSDCVRSILFSEDGRYMLTGSSDTTIKLWSLAAHRCLHTFNHHDSSVWALHSTHPNLERFYSGSRDGHLCVVDLERCHDISDGECVVLAREGETPRNGTYESKTGDEGIRDIVAMDDEYVWTATGSAEIKRWKDVGRRIDRLDKEFEGQAYHPPSPPADVAITVPSGLGDPFVPTPIADGDKRTSMLSIDGGNDGPQRSVAFVSTPSPRNGPTQDSPNAVSTDTTNLSPVSAMTNAVSALSGAVRDRLNLGAPQQRQSSRTGASVANSFLSESSVNVDMDLLSLNGVPYESLVCLGLPDSPYSFGFSSYRHDDAQTMRSAASAGGLSGYLKPDGEGSPRKQSLQMEREHTQKHRARIEFEDREIASEAVPLRREPDEVIAGRSGLVRSLILNDRQHVLSVDTEGEVAVWNIIRGVCVGRFDTAEVVKELHLERGEPAQTAVRKHSQDVLDMVKERVEGETMVITWCQVDTKIGSLVVHLEEGRVFDAEIYADELGLGGMEGMREDSRINLGKWALANLFKGLIKAEEGEVRDLAAGHSPSTISSHVPSISPAPAPVQISINRPPVAPPHRKRALTGSFSGSRPPSLNIPGLVSPAARPAQLPDVEDDDDNHLSKSAPESAGHWLSFHALKNGAGPLSAIPQSPALSHPGGTASPASEVPARDYFSPKRKTDHSPSREGNSSPAIPSTPAGRSSYTPSTPGPSGGSFMGKLKGLGKKKQVETPMSTVPEKVVTPEDEGPKLSEREAEQLHILDTVRSHAFLPPPPWEAPPLDYPPSTALLISEESKDAGAWVVTYRSQVSSTERDMESIEMNSPLWLLDYLFASRIRVKDPVKFTFLLEPAPGSNMKQLPEGAQRLSASRALRAKKLAAFIADKLDLAPKQRGFNSLRKPSITTSSSSNRPHEMEEGTNTAGPAAEDYLELLCGSMVVDPNITLATLKAYYGSGPDMLLHYRMKK